MIGFSRSDAASARSLAESLRGGSPAAASDYKTPAVDEPLQPTVAETRAVTFKAPD